MKYWIAALLCFGLYAASAQKEIDFEDYARKVYGYVTATDSTATVDFIWEDHYLDLIEKQDWTDKKKSLEKHNYSRNYSKYFQDFADMQYDLRKEYETAIENGAKVKFLSFYTEPHPELNNVWTVNTLFLFEHDGLQNRVRISSQATVINDLIIAIAPLKEHF